MVEALRWDAQDELDGAWTRFRAALADRIERLEEHEPMTLGQAAGPDEAAPTVLVTRLGSGAVELSMAGNRAFSPGRRLSRSALARLRATGLVRRGPAYALTVEPGLVDLAAVRVVEILREACGILLPSDLAHGGLVDGQWPADVLAPAPAPSPAGRRTTGVARRAAVGGEPAPGDHPAFEGIERFTAYPAESRDELVALVEATLREVLEIEDPVRDDDGDWPFLGPQGGFFVRVCADRAQVQVFAQVLPCVGHPKAAQRAVNAFNRSHPSMRMWVDEDTVELWLDVPGQPFVPQHLVAAMNRFTDTYAEVGPLLAGIVG